MRTRRMGATLGALSMVVASVGAVAVAPEAGGIVGGRTVAPGEFPSVVELTSPTYGTRCTASLIHPTVVLTAAHCTFAGALTTDVQVRIGNDVFGTGGEVIPVKQIIVHPDYAGGPDDLALLRLEWPSVHQPIRLAQPAEAAYWDGAGDFPTALGWGFVDAGTTLASRLQRATVNLNPDTGDPLGHMRISLDDDFNSAGPCQGDSGGPLLVQMADGTFHQAGVLKAANCNGGGWYSEVGAGPNHTWIRSHIPDLDAPVYSRYAPTPSAWPPTATSRAHRYGG
jgi:hypothetical protein